MPTLPALFHQVGRGISAAFWPVVSNGESAAGVLTARRNVRRLDGDENFVRIPFGPAGRGEDALRQTSARMIAIIRCFAIQTCSGRWPKKCGPRPRT